jgi:hypothetical protein
MTQTIHVFLIGLSSSQIETIKDALKELGWGFRLVSREEEHIVVQQLLDTEYRLIFINSEYIKNHPQVGKTIFYLPMEKRRNEIFVLINKDAKTLDSFLAFKKNVNAVINVKDLSQLAKLLPQIISFDKIIYQGFQRMRKELEVF